MGSLPIQLENLSCTCQRVEVPIFAFLYSGTLGSDCDPITMSLVGSTFLSQVGAGTLNTAQSPRLSREERQEGVGTDFNLKTKKNFF